MTPPLALHTRSGHPDFLDLPWGAPLSAWPELCSRSVELQRGLSRHEVQFVSYENAVYAFKELVEGAAEREYDLLMEMEVLGLPVVTPVGHVHDRREGSENVSILITRYLDASHPYRVLFQNPGLERYRERLLDAMAGLIVRLHLAGVYWGDVSLSNTLFRRDAGQLGAYMVDAETSEIHEKLSDGQRNQDLMILEENVLKSADFNNRTTIEEIRDIIRDAGFVPAQRTTLYEILRTYDEVPVQLM